MSYSTSQIYSIAYFINFLIIIKRLKEKNIIKKNGIFPEKENMENIKNGYRAHMVSGLKKYIQYYFPDAVVKKERVGLKFKITVDLGEIKPIKEHPLIYRLFLESIHSRQTGITPRRDLGLFSVNINRSNSSYGAKQQFDIIIEMKEKDLLGEGCVANSIDLIGEEFGKPFDFNTLSENEIKKSVDRSLASLITRMNSYGWLSVTEPVQRKREVKAIGQFEGIGVSKYSFEETLNVNGIKLDDDGAYLTTTNVQDAINYLTQLRPSIAQQIKTENDEIVFNNFTKYYQDLIDEGQLPERALTFAKSFFPNIVRKDEITTEMMEEYINI